MFLYQKRSRNRDALAKKHSDESRANQTCPECGTGMVLKEEGKDRTVYFCEHCKTNNIFTKLPDTPKDGKVTKLSMISVRERGSKKTPTDETVKEIGDATDSISTVRKGMESRQVVSFEYCSVGGTKSSRVVEPYQLTVNKLGEPVLYGYDIEAGCIRMFKLRGMRSVATQEYAFTPRWDVEDNLPRKKDGKKE